MAVKPGGEDRMSKLIILSSLILGLYGMVMWVIAFVLFANNGHIYEPVTWIAITEAVMAGIFTLLIGAGLVLYLKWTLRR